MNDWSRHACVKVCLRSDSIDQMSSARLPFAIPLIHFSDHQFVFCIGHILEIVIIDIQFSVWVGGPNSFESDLDVLISPLSKSVRFSRLCHSYRAYLQDIVERVAAHMVSINRLFDYIRRADLALLTVAHTNLVT